jgi:hypothetical protein
MEPATIAPMNLEEEDTDVIARDDQMEDINVKTQTAVASLKTNIIKFKRELFQETVSNDTTHSPSNLEAMIGFHSRFLHIISFWLSLLNDQKVPIPEFDIPQHKNAFIRLTRQIQTLRKESNDAYVLVYSLLFQFTQQHPFDMGGQQN